MIFFCRTIQSPSRIRSQIKWGSRWFGLANWLAHHHLSDCHVPGWRGGKSQPRRPPNPSYNQSHTHTPRRSAKCPNPRSGRQKISWLSQRRIGRRRRAKKKIKLKRGKKSVTTFLSYYYYYYFPAARLPGWCGCGTVGCVGGTCPVGPARPRALSRRARHRVAHDWAGPSRRCRGDGRRRDATHRRTTLAHGCYHSLWCCLPWIGKFFGRRGYMRIPRKRPPERSQPRALGKCSFLWNPSKVLLPH